MEQDLPGYLIPAIKLDGLVKSRLKETFCFAGFADIYQNGKRYAASACIYHSVGGDTISFVSQSWQREKALVYNMTWQSDTRLSGAEYWLGADRWDGYYFRTGYIDLIRGTFGDRTLP
jgi:hypothetical protein